MAAGDFLAKITENWVANSSTPRRELPAEAWAEKKLCPFKWCFWGHAAF